MVRRKLPAFVLAAAALAACGEDEGEDEAILPAPVIDLVVDANRNGRLDPGAADEEAGEEGFSATAGAIFLANLDDDDGNGIPDGADEAVAGDADVRDLAPLLVAPWPGAPDGASARLEVENSDEVRLFLVEGAREAAASYVAVQDPLAVSISTDALRAGAAFALEGRHFASSVAAGAWDGTVGITLTVFDAAGASLGSDRVELRVAPLLFQFNTAPTERIYYSDGGDLNERFAAGVQTMADAAGVPFEGLELPGSFWEWDPWTQDFFDVGFTSIPGPDGVPVGMKVAVRSAQPDRIAGEIVDSRFAGPDWGTVYVHAADWAAAAETDGYSMNSFGNWEVVPPYGDHPLGRNVWGAGDSAREQPDPAFVDFVRAQRVQPEIVVDTSWLLVGHVDEVFSWVQADTPRGWRLLVADPTMAHEMLVGLQQSGQGDAVLFEGKRWIDWQREVEVPADVTVDEILADADLMAASQEAQIRTDEMLAILEEELGLAPEEITPMPFVYEDFFGIGLVAHQPGTVNLLHVDGHVVIPDPFGPVVGGVDLFRADLEARLGALGLEVFFADNWDVYHRNLGEVHCGTNVERRMDLRWWESGR
ncbi:protein-arginine deiminase family protein [Vulgatibacter sp.]|uniref:protein-arginine deiminase family protein n=1 Tax=Vulgatibacter sp. TaxID=1971226 RepID=UPI003563D8C1